MAQDPAVLFCRVSFPKQVIMDQEANFMSKVLMQMWHLLDDQPLHTTVYHPQMNGLVEHFNGALKQMLRKYLGQNGKDWPQ